MTLSTAYQPSQLRVAAADHLKWSRLWIRSALNAMIPGGVSAAHVAEAVAAAMGHRSSIALVRYLDDPSRDRLEWLPMDMRLARDRLRRLGYDTCGMVVDSQLFRDATLAPIYMARDAVVLGTNDIDPPEFGFAPERPRLAMPMVEDAAETVDQALATLDWNSLPKLLHRALEAVLPKDTSSATRGTLMRLATSASRAMMARHMHVLGRWWTLADLEAALRLEFLAAVLQPGGRAILDHRDRHSCRRYLRRLPGFVEGAPAAKQLPDTRKRHAEFEAVLREALGLLRHGEADLPARITRGDVNWAALRASRCVASACPSDPDGRSEQRQLG